MDLSAITPLKNATINVSVAMSPMVDFTGELDLPEDADATTYTIEVIQDLDYSVKLTDVYGEDDIVVDADNMFTIPNAPYDYLALLIYADDNDYPSYYAYAGDLNEMDNEDGVIDLRLVSLTETTVVKGNVYGGYEGNSLDMEIPVTVTVYDRMTSYEEEVMTTTDGAFEFAGVPFGSCTISVDGVNIKDETPVTPELNFVTRWFDGSEWHTTTTVNNLNNVDEITEDIILPANTDEPNFKLEIEDIVASTTSIVVTFSNPIATDILAELAVDSNIGGYNKVVTLVDSSNNEVTGTRYKMNDDKTVMTITPGAELNLSEEYDLLFNDGLYADGVGEFDNLDDIDGIEGASYFWIGADWVYGFENEIEIKANDTEFTAIAPTIVTATSDDVDTEKVEIKGNANEVTKIRVSLPTNMDELASIKIYTRTDAANDSFELLTTVYSSSIDPIEKLNGYVDVNQTLNYEELTWNKKVYVTAIPVNKNGREAELPLKDEFEDGTNVLEIADNVAPAIDKNYSKGINDSYTYSDSDNLSLDNLILGENTISMNSKMTTVSGITLTNVELFSAGTNVAIDQDTNEITFDLEAPTYTATNVTTTTSSITITVGSTKGLWKGANLKDQYGQYFSVQTIENDTKLKLEKYSFTGDLGEGEELTLTSDPFSRLGASVTITDSSLDNGDTFTVPSSTNIAVGDVLGFNYDDSISKDDDYAILKVTKIVNTDDGNTYTVTVTELEGDKTKVGDTLNSYVIHEARELKISGVTDTSGNSTDITIKYNENSYTLKDNEDATANSWYTE